MADDEDFSAVTRRLLFGRSAGKIPGAGSSAAERSERHLRTKVTMNLDRDVVTFLKEQAKTDGRSYQLLINKILREYMEGSRPEKLARQAGELLLNSDSFIEALAERVKSAANQPERHKAEAPVIRTKVKPRKR